MNRETLPGFPTIRETVFEHSGIKCLELIKEVPDNKLKLIWVRSSLEELEINGKPNYLVHTDYPIKSPNQSVWEDAARRRVQETFDKYWDIG